MIPESDKLPRFSIFLPVVKTKYFREAFESCAAQTFDDYEIVVLDNGADGDVSFVNGNPRTRYFRNERKLNFKENWKKGFSLCRGEWVQLFSDDDLLEAALLEKLSLFLHAHESEVDIVTEHFKRIGADGKTIDFSSFGRPVSTVGEYIYGRGVTCVSNLAVRRSTLLNAPILNELDDDGWGLDQELVIAIGGARNAIGCLNDLLVAYRWHPDNVTLSKVDPERGMNQLMACCNLVQRTLETLKRTGGDYAELSAPRVINNVLRWALGTFYGKVDNFGGPRAVRAFHREFSRRISECPLMELREAATRIAMDENWKHGRGRLARMCHKASECVRKITGR
jgi:glycosyltransferase involved in cell wall biosynthesis